MRGSVVPTWPLIGRRAEKAAFDELLADPDRRGIVLCGPEGIGKSRLAEEFLHRATRAGYRPGRAVATAAAAAVPLGAIAHLVPDNIDFTNPGAAFAAIADSLSGDRRILLIDDAHLLDATSAKLLRRLTDWRAVFLVATFRTDSGTSVADVLGNSVTRVDLDPLDEDGVSDVLHGVLAQPVARRTVRLLFLASQGNPLYLREITTGALDSEALVFSGELWELDESMPLGTPLLADLIERRLHTVDPLGRPVLETLALCGPVAPADLLELAPARVLADLAAADLVRLLRNGRRGLVALEHPLYGEVIRDRIPKLLHAEILQAQAERIRRRGSKRRQDALTIVTWELAATGTSDPHLLRQAAGLAFHTADHCQVVSLLDALPQHEHTTTTRLLLGQSHFLLGYWSEAERVLAAAADAAVDDTERLVVTGFRVTNLLWANTDVAVAMAVNDAMRQQVSGPAARVLLGLNEAMALLASRRPAAALTLLDALSEDPDLPAHEGAWVRLAAFRASALAVLGRAPEAVESATKIHSTFLSDTQDLSSHPSARLSVLVQALTETGQLIEAVQVGREAFDDLVTAGLPNPRLWLAVFLGRAEWLAGHPRSARQWFTEAIGLGQRIDHLGALRLSLSGVAACLSVLGDLPAAEVALAALDRLPVQKCGLLAEGEEKLGEAWLQAAKGRLVQAREILTAAAENAQTSGHVASEVMLRTDIARLGGAREVAARLAELAAADDSKFTQARAQFADGLARSDASTLAEAAAACEAMGAHLMAAEASTVAANSWRQAGYQQRSATAASKTEALLAHCQDARTPLLGLADVALVLTEREREIALFAARRATSRDIADALSISVRTVDNHLQRIYAKLGVTSRRDLADTLG